MKKNDKNLNLVPLKAKELLQIKGGLRKIPSGSLTPTSKYSSLWEEVDIRFDGGNTNSKKLTSTIKTSFIKMK